ncbi:MarR family transcriptional regulator [Odoribacter sp. OttesenSCG-928-J03]|nr:MarR family transcriptional regulator [Odoribacter sp. OttesenSCG-928-J03]MDL2282998.1 MarR family transcriptional regulator [Odoribacter sp. OttesenSCG-928-G04]MDL2331108.1 MarR family transcriptional regulator [Odoribacter sp. OttesenSCG-928-A06]
METLCQIRDIYRSIAEFEMQFEKVYDLCLNEGMLLCTLSKVEKLTSGQLAELMGLSLSNTSKVIKEVENKGLIMRLLGNTDKRQMYFSLTPAGKKKLDSIKSAEIELPDLLRVVVDKYSIHCN